MDRLRGILDLVCEALEEYLGVSKKQIFKYRQN
jgi:hypothetical protein